MNKLLLSGLVKALLVFVAACLAVFALCYLAYQALIRSGMQQVLFLPAVLAVAAVLWLFRLILGPTLEAMKATRTRHGERD